MEPLFVIEAGIEVFHHRPLKEEIFEILHKRIISGKYVLGEWLRQEEIASQLGVSQTPVREALDLLVSAGLAERVPYRGVRVPSLTAEEIAEAYALRLLLETVAVRAAATNRTMAHIETLSRLSEQSKALVTLNDMPNLRLLNREFHLSMVMASGNSLLTKMYVMVSNKFPDWMLYEYMFRHPDLLEPNLRREYEEHKAIAGAITDSDADLAIQHTIKHIRNLGNELVIFLDVPESLLRAAEEHLGSLIKFHK